jgi:hypothetical protein
MPVQEPLRQVPTLRDMTPTAERFLDLGRDDNIQKYGNTTAASIPICMTRRSSSARSSPATWSAWSRSAPA